MRSHGKVLLISAGLIAGFVALVAAFAKKERVVIVAISPLRQDGVAKAIVECLRQHAQMKGALEVSIISGGREHTIAFRDGNRLKPKPLAVERIQRALDSLFSQTIMPPSAQALEALFHADASMLVIVNADSSAPFFVPTDKVGVTHVCWLGVLTPAAHELADKIRRKGGTFEVVEARFDAITSSLARWKSDSVGMDSSVSSPTTQGMLLDVYVVSAPDDAYRTVLWRHLDSLIERSRNIIVHRVDTVIVLRGGVSQWEVRHAVSSAPQAGIFDYPNLFAPLRRHCKTTEPVQVVIIGNMNQPGERRIVDLRCLRRRNNLRITIATDEGLGRMIWRDAVKSLEVSAYVIQ